MSDEHIVCAFCGGQGKDPFDIMSSLSTCCVCGGRRTVRVRSPLSQCAHCQGTGAVKTLTCTTCGGKGSVHKPLLPTVACPVCSGTGDDASAPAMACLKCRGNGWVVQQRVIETIADSGKDRSRVSKGGEVTT